MIEQHPLDLKSLRHFAALVEHQGFIRAGEAIGLSQPALSRREVLVRQMCGGDPAKAQVLRSVIFPPVTAAGGAHPHDLPGLTNAPACGYAGDLYHNALDQQPTLSCGEVIQPTAAVILNSDIDLAMDPDIDRSKGVFSARYAHSHVPPPPAPPRLRPRVPGTFS